ncbi:chemotaxis protein CheB [Thiococcus pfennigii]|uniref:chemotaxis protein CheB n=1 Tax=Thiococcus pfennigii TaxID=1057 RepID=UPI001906AA6D|nr:chemotaxis protein CheB [Thiococcus pfennigii]MBK1732289.1 chemotaxis protein CheR [Thiococcus pfennigii]
MAREQRPPHSNPGPGTALVAADTPDSAPPPAGADTRDAGRPGPGDAPTGADQTGDGIDPAPFPIVGIGASAGGLDAFRRLLQRLPVDAGLAYVLIQHLAPSHESLLAPLLAEATAMPVIEARDGRPIEPDHVYVIPPNRTLGVHHRRLVLLERELDSGRHLPVDYFLKTLADDLGRQAIGVILSGTASDGTQGLKAIKAAGGLTFAQDTKSAEYYGMPGSAIAAGCVDLVLPPAEIADELARIAVHPYLRHPPPEVSEGLTETEDDLAKIFLLLRSRTGNDFSLYKRPAILRRIRRRLAVHKLERLADYIHYLQTQPAEIDRLFEDLLISVTAFFREPESFDTLREQVFPHLFDERRAGRRVRVWVPGCATGEEAYSLAIAMQEFLGERAAEIGIQIFASDIDGKAIAKARAGQFDESIVGQVSPERLRRFFVKSAGGYRVTKSIRDLCVFAVQNLIKDPPFSRLDLISCRNLLIYFSAPLQKRALQIFHYALEPNAFLLLGASESIGAQADLFALLDKQRRIYVKKSHVPRVDYSFMPTIHQGPDDGATASPASTARAGREQPDLARTADRLLLAHYAPPGVIVSRDLEILYFHGETGPYMDPAPGAATLNLIKLAHQDLAVELRTSLHKALRTGQEVYRPGVRYRRNGVRAEINLRILPMRTGDEIDHLMVLFEEVSLITDAEPATDAAARAGDDRPRVADLERELAVTREQLQAIIAELEGTNEARQAANEEIQSANEELQSANEELETAKEELQSTNEELATVNDELEGRNRDLAEANSDLNNLLASVNLPILILGQDMRIRQFTPQAGKLLNLIGGDLGRPISNIQANILVPELETRVAAVIEDMAPQVLDLQDNAGRWYSVRLRPYKTLDNRIDGVVIAFIDVDGIKETERLRQTLALERRLATVVRDANDAIMVQGFDGRILAWNPAAERLFGYSESQAIESGIEPLVPAAAWPAYRALLARLARGESVEPQRLERRHADGRILRVLLTATTLLDEHGQPYAAATTERVLGGE